MPVTVAMAGVSPAGFFVAQTFADPGLPPGILADPIDPLTHEYRSIRMGMDPIDAQVLVALKVVRGSGASVQDDGQDFGEIENVDDQTSSLIEAKTRLCLRRLVDNLDIEIVALTPGTEPENAAGSVVLQYKNLRRQRAKVRTLEIMPI